MPCSFNTKHTKSTKALFETNRPKNRFVFFVSFVVKALMGPAKSAQLRQDALPPFAILPGE